MQYSNESVPVKPLPGVYVKDPFSPRLTVPLAATAPLSIATAPLRTWSFPSTPGAATTIVGAVSTLAYVSSTATESAAAAERGSRDDAAGRGDQRREGRAQPFAHDEPPGLVTASASRTRAVTTPGPLPIAFRAFTVQFTVIPFARPVTTNGEPVPVFVFDPHVAV